MLLELTPPDNIKITNTSPDDSDPLKLVDVNCTVNAMKITIQKFKNLKMITYFQDAFY